MLEVRNAPSSSTYHFDLAPDIQVRKFLTATIEEHRDSLEHDQPRDVIDAFLIEAQTTGHPSFTPEQVPVPVSVLVPVPFFLPVSVPVPVISDP